MRDVKISKFAQNKIFANQENQYACGYYVLLFIDKFLSGSTGLIEAIEAKRLCCAIKKINDVQESQCS